MHRATGDGPGDRPLRITQLWRYPVKSMGGEPVALLDTDGRGAVGDRMFAVVLADTGRMVTAKRLPKMLDAAARWLGAAAEITLPGADPVRTDEPGAEAALSAWLGRPVRIERATSAPGVMEYEAEAGDLNTVALPAGTFVDEAPLHLLSEQSMVAARWWHPDGAWRVRRFRPNVVLGGDLDPETDAGVGPPEDGWAGHEVALGASVLDVTGPCQRCVMVTHPQGDLPRDSAILRTLSRRHGAEFGVYADVVTGGALALGDEARVRQLAGGRLAP